MNTAIFIDRESTADNEVLTQVEKIRMAQEEIMDGLRDLEMSASQVEFVKVEDIHKPVVVVDEEILDKCCEKITSNIHLVKEVYGRLIKMGVFESRSRRPGSDFSHQEYRQLL